MAGLLPIMWSYGSGADVMKRIATPMVGGMVTSVIVVLLVYPAIYYIWKGWNLAAFALTRDASLRPFIPTSRQPLRELYERVHSQKRRIRQKLVGIDRRERGPIERQPSFFATQLDHDPVPTRSWAPG